VLSLISKSEAILACKQGYDYYVTETTGPFSRKAALKDQYIALNFIEYKNYAHEGKRPFETLEGGVTFMVKDLNDKTKNIIYP
jgi:hypothetical protein